MIGVDELKKVLLNQCRDKTVKLPQSWFDFYKVLADKKSLSDCPGFLPTSDVASLCPKSVASRNIFPCLKYLHQRGVVFWFGGDSRLANFVFLDISLVVNILKEVLDYKLDESVETKQWNDYLSTMTELKQAVQKFRRTGIASENFLKFLLRDVAENNETFSLAVTFLKLFSLCFEDSSSDSAHSLTSAEPTPPATKLLYFPWFIRDRISDTELNCLWPEKLREGIIPLKCVFTFAHKIPTSLFEHFSVHLQTRLVRGHRRQDWKDTICITQNGIKLLIQRQNDPKADRAHLNVSLRNEAKNAFAMYKLCMSVVRL